MATNLYVGNLPYSVDNDQLWQMFSPYGDVVSANVIFDRASGQSKGFGFVEMANEEGAQRAISDLNGTQVGNRTIRVSESLPRDQSGGGRPPRRDRDSGGYGGDRRESRW